MRPNRATAETMTSAVNAFSSILLVPYVADRSAASHRNRQKSYGVTQPGAAVFSQGLFLIEAIEVSAIDLPLFPAFAAALTTGERDCTL